MIDIGKVLLKVINFEMGFDFDSWVGKWTKNKYKKKIKTNKPDVW